MFRCRRDPLHTTYYMTNTHCTIINNIRHVVCWIGIGFYNDKISLTNLVRYFSKGLVLEKYNYMIRLYCLK